MAHTTYDPKCEELARYFLEGELTTAQLVSDAGNGSVRLLSVAIQAAIEDWFSGERFGREATAPQMVVGDAGCD